VSIIGVSLSSLIFLFKDPLLALYGVVDGAEGSLEALAMDAATTQLIYNSLPYFLCGFMEVGSGVLRGLGKSFTSMIISLIGSCLLRVVWLLTVFPAYPTLATIYVCYPITWALTAVVLHTCAIVVINRKIKLGRNQ
jgi:Na+-driven multidrug efflux pump